MNYQKIYDQIIKRAQNRVLSTYKERHHILPKCMGGSDKEENLVDLTAREHFLVHWLLVRIHPENRKLLYALIAMCNFKSREKRYFPSSRVYSELKENLSRLGKSPSHKRKISETNKKSQLLRPPVSDVTREKLRQVHLGKKKDREVVERIRKSNTGKKRSELARQNISNSLKGNKHTPEVIEKRRQSILKVRDSISEKIRVIKTGTRHSPESREKMRKSALIREQRKREKNGTV